MPSASSSVAAWETSGRRRRSASAPQRTAPSESPACWPSRTRSAFSALDRRRQHRRRREHVRSRGAVVGDEQHPVGAHRERLAHRLGRARRAHGDDDHLGRRVPVLHPQRLLERVGVELVQRPLAASVEAERRGVEPPRRRGVRDFLHAAPRSSRPRAYPHVSLQNAGRRLLAFGPSRARPEPMLTSHRTTARSTLLAFLIGGLLAGPAGAAVPGDDPLPGRRADAVPGRLRRPARLAPPSGERHHGRARIARGGRRGRPRADLPRLVERRLHALFLRRQRHGLLLHPPERRPHEARRQPRDRLPQGRRLRGEPAERHARSRRGADRLRRELRRRARHLAAPPLRAAPRRPRRPLAVPVAQARAAPALRGEAAHGVDAPLAGRDGEGGGEGLRASRDAGLRGVRLARQAGSAHGDARARSQARRAAAQGWNAGCPRSSPGRRSGSGCRCSRPGSSRR